MEKLHFEWTDSTSEQFRRFYLITEEFYSSLVGGAENRQGFIPYNLSDSIQDVLLAYAGEKCVGCAGLKEYSRQDAEIKRVWVEPAYRNRKIATQMMALIEEKAAEKGFLRTILQTREVMREAVELYRKLGYVRIPNYPPYDKLDGAICFGKNLR